MPTLSEKAKLMPSSPIRKLVPFAEGAKKRGIKVFHLNIGQPDLATPPLFFEAINKAKLETLEYSHSAGIESYRRKLATYYQKFSLSVDYTNILITTGGSEALRFVFMACLNAGDEVIVPEPLYANYIGFAVEAGIKIVPITTDISKGYALPNAETFEKLITPKTKAIMICNPSNPTGKLMPLSELEALRDIVKEKNLYLFADEVYKEFCYDGETFYSTLNLKGIEENVVVIDSVSKRYSACGARIGCLISRNKELINSILKFAQARLSPPTLGQVGAEALCELPQSYFDGVTKEYVARRDVVIKALSQMEGVICPKASGAFYLMPQFPIDNSDRFCQWLLEEFNYKNTTVMMAPGTGFYATPGMGLQQARIAYVLDCEELTQAMECLKVALQQYFNKIKTHTKELITSI